MNTPNETEFRLLSIDAWNGPDGWQWNNWCHVGNVPRAWADLKPRALFREMRDAGFLSWASAGLLAIEDDGYNVVIVARSTREPLFAIEYGAAD